MNCQGCRWWSEMIAESIGLGPVKAMCLNLGSTKYQQMVHIACDKRQEGTAVDDPYERCEL